MSIRIIKYDIITILKEIFLTPPLITIQEPAIQYILSTSQNYQYISIRYKNSGCNGFEFYLEPTQTPHQDDFQWSQDGINFGCKFIDLESIDLESIDGLEISLQETLINKKIIFSIQGSTSCGCGKSLKMPIKEKPPIFTTNDAIIKIKDLILETNNPQNKLRIAVAGGGCSGFQYQFSLDDVIQEDDIIIGKQSSQIIIDVMSMQYLKDSTLDYKDELMDSGFKISNPNFNTTCGCGASFS